MCLLRCRHFNKSVRGRTSAVRVSADNETLAVNKETLTVKNENHVAE